jgi:hypothetical protein
MKSIVHAAGRQACLRIVVLVGAAMMAQVATSQEGNRATGNIPLIQMDRVPITDAIKNLARQAGLNYILDPRLAGPWIDDAGKSGRAPSVSLRWENMTAEQGLVKLLKEHGLAMVADPATSITRIAFTNQVIKPIPASQVDDGTNSVIPLIVLDSVPLPDAIKNIARQAQLDLSLDPALRAPAGGRVSRKLSEWEVSVRWENVTLRQALAALLDNYGLMLVPEAGRSSVKVAVKPQP